MYKIESVEINGFWLRFNMGCSFNPDVNIIIGKNGTGKTTFMNILHAVLAIDVSVLAENDFNSIKIIIIKGGSRRTIRAKKVDFPDYPFPAIEYQISQRKTLLRLYNFDERRASVAYRKHLQEQALDLRKELDSLIALASLSVYRLRSDDDYEVRDRHGARMVAPVDYRLEQALRGLTQYQLELSQKAREVAAKLQSDVLASILYGEEDANDAGYRLEFDKADEQGRLVSAYQQLNALSSDVRKKIKFHVTAIDDAIRDITRSSEVVDSQQKPRSINIKPLEALRKTRRIIDLSLEAKESTQAIFSQVELFLNIIKEFIPEKKFSFQSGLLNISTSHGVVDHSKLSSGEKQLIILLAEALLQKRQEYVFLADEPELSLHIAWQRMVIPAVRKINPNAQIIVATHSPEVASKYPEAILNMEGMVNG